MKRITSILFVLILLLSFSVSAFADISMYTVKDNVNVYAEQSTESAIVKTLAKGVEVQVKVKGETWCTVADGYYILTEDLCEHDFGPWASMAPTCTTKGERSRVCLNCGLVEKQEIDMIPHSFGDWTVTKAPTCTAKGERSHSCSMCGLTETQAIDMVPHTFGDWMVQKEATCTAQGVMFRTCTTCNLEETRPIDKKPHSFGDWIVRREPTCTKEGVRYHLCKNCGLEETMSIEKTPHSYGDWVVQREPTCTMEGLKARWCKVCGFEQTKSIDKLPHNYGDWVVTLEATDHSAGEKTRICQDCGRVQTRSFDPEGTLRRGDKGDAVREIQQLLADQGYLKAKGVDGSYGGGTEKAITQFQKDQGLNPDGIAWPETIRRLHHTFGDWTVVSALSRETDGESIRVCTECGYTEHKITPASPSFARGDKGRSLKGVQQMLNAMGFDCGELDGSYGRKLELAWESFALENGIMPTLDRLLPADIDQIADAWLDFLPEERWMGQGDKDSSVNLILTVTPTGEENGLLSFDWTLSNLGGEKARFVTLLLGYGEGHDFRTDNLVVEVDYARLKADGENRQSGSFTIAADWAGDASTFSFCALAIEDETGAVWSSNAISFNA